MNTFAAECSSGCESGWTLYFEHSFLNQNASSHRDNTQFVGGAEGFYEEGRHKEKRGKGYENYGEEDDLSMVSDASSGPPHFPDDEHYFNEEVNGCFYSASKAVKLEKSGKNKHNVKVNQHLEDQHLPSFLHDTASSPFFDFSTNNVTKANQQNSMGSMLDYSQGFSATYFEGTSPFQEPHFGFLQPSLSENELEGNKWYAGKGMGIG
ncbi:hypothetical protein RJT34_18117 [Clitoria ternatea]|uniref:Uncharacterized protein n=1 Tax=Clitoria ternatea TaxID=43366 RepID=A0AAN9JA74_CLITE